MSTLSYGDVAGFNTVSLCHRFVWHQQCRNRLVMRFSMSIKVLNILLLFQYKKSLFELSKKIIFTIHKTTKTLISECHPQKYTYY